MEDADELLFADGGTTTNWECRARSVRTWLGRERRACTGSGLMVEVVGGGNTERVESVETDMVAVEAARRQWRSFRCCARCFEEEQHHGPCEDGI